MTRVSANAAVGYALVLTVCVVTFSSKWQRPANGLGVRRRVFASAGRARPAAVQAALRHVPRRSIAGRGRRVAADGTAISSRTGAGVRCRIWSTRFRRRCRSTRQAVCRGSNRSISPRAFSRRASSRLDARELTEGALAGVRLPTVRAAAAPVAASSAALPPPVGNLAELMRAIAFYNSNIIFNLQPGIPPTRPKKPQPAPFDYVEWGYTIYPGWLAVDQAAVALTETAHVLSTPGRRCQNGRPVPLDRADWQKFVDDLAKVGKDIYAASKARNYEKVVALSDTLNETCANCHKVYRDSGGLEGSGGNRCQAMP